jgi:hypothetical protein
LRAAAAVANLVDLMSFWEGNEWGETRPVTWWRGHAIYAAHVLAAVLVVTMIITSVALFAGADVALGSLGFSSSAVLRGELWRVITYGLVNPPSLAFALDVVMLIWFGREVEKALGRARFLALCGGIYLLKPLCFAGAGLWLGTAFSGAAVAFPIFVAFATLFPGVPLLFQILAKWAAIALVGIQALVALAGRRWDLLVEILVGCGFAHLFIRWFRDGFELPKFRWRRPRPVARPAGTVRPAGPQSVVPPPRAGMAEVDALLDKIAQSGIHSLTREERARLEAARSDLLRRGSGGQ